MKIETSKINNTKIYLESNLALSDSSIRIAFESGDSKTVIVFSDIDELKILQSVVDNVISSATENDVVLTDASSISDLAQSLPNSVTEMYSLALKSLNNTTGFYDTEDGTILNFALNKSGVMTDES